MTTPLPANLPGDVAACIGFYTRLPVSAGSEGERPFASAQWAAPVAGAVVGLVVGVLAWLAIAAGMPASVAAVLALGAGVALTGALHEDGLADVADGFGGGRTRERKLEIMRDSRLGSYGALALGLSLLARWAALAALATAPAMTMILAVVAAHAASRATIPALMARVPPARTDGLSAGIGRADAQVALSALAIGFVLAALSGFWFAVMAAIVLACLFALIEKLALSQIGGQTGDVLGALQQAGEIAVLVVAATYLA